MEPTEPQQRPKRARREPKPVDWPELDTALFMQGAASSADVATFMEELTLKERLVYSAITDPIQLEEFPYETDILSPTPGDPAEVETFDTKYVDGARSFMLDVHQRRQQTVMDTMLVPVAQEQMTAEQASEILLALTDIRTEIINQHNRQLHKNYASMLRLQALFFYKKNRFRPAAGMPIESVTEPIVRMRAGLGATDERARFLGKYPEMGAIEDMKSTVPLNIKAYRRAKQVYYVKLMRIDKQNDDISISLIPIAEQKPWPKDVREAAPKDVEVRKAVVGTITINGVELEIVEHSSFYAFPLSLQVPGIQPRKAKSKIEGGYANLQPITVSMYLRVKGTQEMEPIDEGGEVPTEGSVRKRMSNLVLRLVKGRSIRPEKNK